jgi:MFS family permease
LVSFPAASSVLTSKAGFGLSASQYGTMFAPQVIAVIAASLLGGRLASRFGLKRVYLAGLAADLLSMLVLAGSSLLTHDGATAYVALLLATALLGIGFGLTVPALNTFTSAFHPNSVDRSTLVLNALLGLGTALAPAFSAVFVGLGFWWGLPLLAAVLFVALGIVAVKLPLTVDTSAKSNSGDRPGLPGRFWPYAIAALLYGIVETMSGNWGQRQLTSGLHGTAMQASLALTAFWAMVTIGRVLFAAIQSKVPGRWIYRVIPFLIAVAYLVVVLGATGSPVVGILAFGLAGLGCSAMLPFTLSFAEEELGSTGALTGRLIAVYQVGYGIAAFGVGPLTSGGLTLDAVFGATAAVAVALSLAAFVVAGRRGAPAVV